MPPSWLQVPHRRFNPLSRQWVLVSPHRTQRPWQGEVAKTDAPSAIHYDPTCYLCPGNARAGGHRNPQYDGVFIFNNDYAALLPVNPPLQDAPHDDLLRVESERGICRVICFHPDHDLTLARMQSPDIERVVDAWTAQSQELGDQPEIRYVQIFENRGAMMGASNPHPHCQVWATEHVPDGPRIEQIAQQEYRESHGTCLLCDYLQREVQLAQRIVCQNDEFVALVPFWAVWPFETLVLSRRHVASLPEMNQSQRAALADILKRLTTRYDNLFQISFPYTMGFHPSPADAQPHPEWHFHAHFYPPLLRSATVRKFMVGFEMLGMPQRDITPESAAERLRALSDLHYTLKQ
ncbi:MAG TPA: UDP-glucose--hexose-1-phosphate uridylyltransferase [Acidobacteriaceae bacterium]|nr:UDP-glucose--hexose-1-phosphate uridylyltransferase [Terriglobia bacterium]HVC89047.1 UDP-glucose--hexose-1-phosphate uridylyltransferase [Acidobacteriaceae bacterium]